MNNFPSYTNFSLHTRTHAHVHARTAFMVFIGTSFAQTSLPKSGDKKEAFIEIQLNTQLYSNK